MKLAVPPHLARQLHEQKVKCRYKKGCIRMCTMNKNNFAHYFVKLYNKQTAIDTVTLTHSLVLLGANYVLHKRRSKKKLARHTPTSSLLLLPQCLHGLFRFFLRFRFLFLFRFFGCNPLRSLCGYTFPSPVAPLAIDLLLQ